MYRLSAFRRSIHVQASSEAFLFIDSVFPIRLGRWDLRYYIGLLRERYLLNKINSYLESVNSHGFHVLSLEPYYKDGGVFVRFQYLKGDSNNALDDILAQTRHVFARHGGAPSWTGTYRRGRAWIVRGTPWKEDMDRFASPVLKVTFEGSNIHEQSLFQTFRPFGRIRDVTSPSGVPHTATIVYERLKSAVIARNVIHGFENGFDSPAISKTCLRAEYQKPIQAHAIRNWISSHPRIVIPLVVFLLGALTYTVFDPLRSLMIQAKILHWFDYREFSLVKWLQEYTMDQCTPTGDDLMPGTDVWKERKEAEASLKTYLSEKPNTIAFLYGPQGSGKHRMVESAVHEFGRNILLVDCTQLSLATSDAQLIGALATQTGYRPVFTFLNSITTLIDVASTSLIGQKTGLGSSVPDQLRQVLQTTTMALEQIVIKRRARADSQNGRSEQSKAVGFGIEDAAMEILPVVIISHFSSRVGPHKEELPDILVHWAANLVEKQVAHVVVISDNRENAKQAAKALPTRPLHIVQLSDADIASSLSFLRQKLRNTGVNIEFSEKQVAYVDRLGGRASDLENLIHKVRTGQPVEDVVEEIIERGVNELRKKAFGEDEEESKRLPWTREQAWRIVKLLSDQFEIPYYDILYSVPFSGEEASLREMEHAEIISIGTLDGRPSTIKPGKPILKWVFSRLTSDSVFAAKEEISYNSKVISSCERTIKSCEDELVALKQVTETQSLGWFATSYDRGVQSRARYVASKIHAAQKKLETLESANKGFKTILARGDKKY